MSLPPAKAAGSAPPSSLKTQGAGAAFARIPTSSLPVTGPRGRGQLEFRDLGPLHASSVELSVQRTPGGQARDRPTARKRRCQRTKQDAFSA